MNYCEDILMLMMFGERFYKTIPLTSRNKGLFENRCYETRICDKVFLCMSENTCVDPEDILYLFESDLKHQCACFKNNKKRSVFLYSMLSVIEKLSKQLKKYRGGF